MGIVQVGSLRALPQPEQELKQAGLFGSPASAPVAVPRYGKSEAFWICYKEFILMDGFSD